MEWTVGSKLELGNSERTGVVVLLTSTVVIRPPSLRFLADFINDHTVCTSCTSEGLLTKLLI